MELTAALHAIRINTTYLWPALVQIKDEQESLVCEVRKPTLDRIAPHLERLSAAGYFKYFTTTGYLFRKSEVFKLRITDISREFRELVRSHAS